MNVADWLRAHGLEQYEAAFRENVVDVEVLPTLTADELKDIGVSSIRHRRRLLEAIAVLRSKSMGPEAPALAPLFPPSDTRGQPGASETTPERRPLSVMFCDLVGSTALSSQLDPEDLREIIRNYQGCVATTIQHFDGFIARYVGDGVLIYFGWPEARETDAERAVRAGLAVASAVSAERPGGQPLQVRIGIATGLVVIGEPIGSGDSRQQTAVGETPNLAARLQSLARPGQVVIDAATRRQIGGLFECQDLGTVELKGLPVAVPAWQVLAENRTLGQFEALRSGATPLVGRDEEMELLLRRWGQAKAGNGRVVLISAEPGVGKSRLAEALAERITGEPHTRLRYFCSPHHQDSALYPVVTQMERAAGFALADGPVAKISKLKALLATTARSKEEVALMADLHSLPSTDLAPPLDVTPQRKKEKTFEALLQRVEGLARHQSVLMIFDDIHWIDPSSRELLDRLIERITGWPVLLLVMFRPEFQPPWIGQPHVMTQTLSRLDRIDTAVMVANVAGNSLLPPEIVEEIAERTDGVPLFVEELTKSMLESGAQVPSALSTVPHPAVSVPATLHASLMARLDRLGPAAKDTAQTGAAIGREFGYALLASVTDLSEPQLREALDRLTNAGLLFVRGTPPQSSYIFKHALVQDAAYGTLLRSRRQLLHARIAGSLEDRFADIVLAQPALLAQHCEAAGQAEKALAYRLTAGQQALARSTMAEAVAHLRKGLDVLADLPDGPWRRQHELDLQIVLRPALAATKGFSAAAVGETLTRARALAEQIDRPEYLVPLSLGQWQFYWVRAEHKLALSLAEQIEKIGEARNDVTAQLLGRCLHGVTHGFLGEFVAARALLEQYLGDPAPRAVGGRLSEDPYATMLASAPLTMPIVAGARDDFHPELSGEHRRAPKGTLTDSNGPVPLGPLRSLPHRHTPAGEPWEVTSGKGRIYLAVTLAYLGYLDQARSRLYEALSEARRLEHAHTLATVLVVANWVESITGSPELQQHAEELLALSTEHGFPFHRASALVYRGRLLIAFGQAREGLALLAQGLAAARATGTVPHTPTRLMWLAEAYAMLGQLAEGLQCLAEAAAIIETTEERYAQAELHRVHGDLLNSAGDRSAAEQHYHQAIAVAERQSAKLLQLRASTSLARLWREQGKREEARELLGPIYSWFTEGFDAPDLKEAKALLDELA